MQKYVMLLHIVAIVGPQFSSQHHKTEGGKNSQSVCQSVVIITYHTWLFVLTF